MDDVTAKPGSIIPSGVASLRTMAVTMTVMCYLACLAIGALILINRAVSDWTQGISREVTVQLRQISAVNADAELAKAVALLAATPGVTAVEPLAREASLKLLEPWLGQTNLEDLPVPRLIRVTVNEAEPPDFTALEQSLTEQVKGASLDTHRRWATELARMAKSLSLLSWWILILISASAVAMVIFAARAALDANREVVDVLRLVGAKNGFIAAQIGRRFLVIGLFAGCAGMALAALTFVILGSIGGADQTSVAAASYSLLFAPHGDGLTTALAVLSVPVVATFIALITAHVTLTHMLRAAP
jgi:cell division transport system permease protein